MDEMWTWLYHHASQRDQSEASLADVLDVKASILLVVVTFLATIAIGVTQLDQLPILVERMQLANNFLLAIGTSLLIGELWPRKYLFEDGDYLDELRDYLISNRDNPEGILGQVVEANASLAIGRVQHNYSLNASKEKLLRYSFRCVLGGVLLQIIILVCLAA